MAFTTVCTSRPLACAAGPRADEPACARRPRTLNLRDPAELDAELRRFSKAVFQDADYLPKSGDLLRARRGDLRYAIARYHGGFRKLRQAREAAAALAAAASAGPALGFAELARAIRAFIEEELVPLDVAHAAVTRTLLPTHAALRAAGRNDLVRAVRAAGGSRAVALRMGLRLHYHATTDYVGEKPRLVAELRRFAAERAAAADGPPAFPTAAELHAAGRLDLIAGLRAHGGARALAAEMDLKLQRGRRARDATELRREMEVLGVAAIPADASLVGAGRVDMIRDVQRLGGRERAAAILGVGGGSEVAKTIFDEAFFAVEVCPDEHILVHNSGNKVRQALRKAPVEERGGGGGALLPRDGGRRRQRHYFSSFARLRQELLCFIFDDGVAGVMPTAQELIKAGRRDLVRAMQLHGGQKSVASKLGLVMHSMGRKKIVQRVTETVAV